MNRCKSCSAPIIWAITKTGNRMPVDARPHPNGNVQLTQEGSATPWATVHKQGPGLFDEWVGHMPHHATCPDADKWRKQ